MTIITKEHLLDTFVRNLLTELTKQRSPHDDKSFDDWAFAHFPEIGEIVYEMIGEHYIDFDSAADDLGVEAEEIWETTA